MTLAIIFKLLALCLTVALGWAVGRMRWLGSPEQDPARVLANAAFYVFMPALLFRTTVRLDFGALPWGTLVAFFVPVMGVLLAVYAWQRWRPGAAADGAAAPAVRAISASFGNSVQIGIPLAAALFGEAGLGLHIALVSLHALVLLSLLTALVELDLARAQRQQAPAAAHSLLRTLGQTARNTLIHPVVLPVLAGMLWNVTGLGLHPVVDETLQVLGSAVVPLCLVLIGMTLAYYGLQGRAAGALRMAAVKLLLQPAAVFAVAYWGFGLSGLPLQVAVIMAALPTGSNALLFAQRYQALQSEATATIVFSTLAFAATATGWLALLTWVG